MSHMFCEHCALVCVDCRAYICVWIQSCSMYTNIFLNMTTTHGLSTEWQATILSANYEHIGQPISVWYEINSSQRKLNIISHQGTPWFTMQIPCHGRCIGLYVCTWARPLVALSFVFQMTQRNAGKHCQLNIRRIKHNYRTEWNNKATYTHRLFRARTKRHFNIA